MVWTRKRGDNAIDEWYSPKMMQSQMSCILRYFVHVLVLCVCIICTANATPTSAMASRRNFADNQPHHPFPVWSPKEITTQGMKAMQMRRFSSRLTLYRYGLPSVAEAPSRRARGDGMIRLDRRKRGILPDQFDCMRWCAPGRSRGWWSQSCDFMEGGTGCGLHPKLVGNVRQDT